MFFKCVAVICSAINNGAYFDFQRFQRHVHTYRILPDADGLLAVQVSIHHHRHRSICPRGKARGKSNTIDV